MFPLRNIFILLSLIVCVPVWAQEDCHFTIQGKVIDEHDGLPLAYATIYVHEIEIGVATDSLGNYVIEGLCPGTYTLVCSHLGCDDVFDTVYVTDHLKLNFYPEHHLEQLEGVKVEAVHIDPVSSQNVEVMSKKELLEVKGQNLGNSLKEVPGVSSLNTGNNISKPVIHGMHSNRVLILNNGIRHEGQQWGNEHAPEIDPSIADELSVVKGANSLRYGPDAIAGVILVNPKGLRRNNGLGGNLSLTGFSNGRQGVASGVIEGNHLKSEALTWRLQGSLKRGGNINTPDYHLKNTGISEQNFSWALGYMKDQYGIELFYSQFNSEIGIFSGSHIGNLTDLEKAFESEEPLEKADFSYEIGRPRQEIEHELFKAKAYLHNSNSSKLELIYARQYNERLEYDKDRSYNDSIAALDLPALQFEITTHTMDLIYTGSRVKEWKLLLGGSGIYQSNTYQGRFFIPNFYKYGFGGFLIERWTPKQSKWEFEAGIRYDVIRQEVFIRQGEKLLEPVHDYANISGNVGAVYKASEALNFKMNTGIAWRPPNVNEMYSNGLHHGSAAVEIGDSNLTEERAYNISLTTEVNKAKWFMNLGLYYNYIDDYIYLRPVQPPTLTIRGAFPTFKYSQVDATISGLDASIGYRIFQALQISLKTSLVRANNRSEGEELVLIPPDRFDYELRYTFDEGKKFKQSFMAVSFLHVLEQTRVPDNSDYVAPPPSYALLGFRAGTAIPLGKQHINFILRIDNILNERYRDYMNRLRYFADDIGRNVSLSITIPFEILNNTNTDKYENN